MNADVEKLVADLVVKHVPLTFFLAVDESLPAAAKRAFDETEGRFQGHRATCLGQARHQLLNEAFVQSLDAASIKHTLLRGNEIVVGQAGPVRLARFNTAMRGWTTARRSAVRCDLAETNRALQELRQPELFDGTFAQPVMVSVFVVAFFSGSLRLEPERPLALQVVVPDRTFESVLFQENITTFIGRYLARTEQVDGATVRLKSRARRPGEDAS